MLFVSTDKAVNPTNVMGTCKRIAELYLQYLNKQKKTEFVITRFGNVLGSSGSVIPTFIQNINDNHNLQITHKDVVRYFMSIPEAAKLVLKAITIGKGEQILLFDMGEPVKILDLAKQLLKLFPSKHLSIEFTGLNPGEKLFEELLCKTECVIPTLDSKIMILKHIEENDDFLQKFNNLMQNYTKLNSIEIKNNIKNIVPEYDIYIS
jgi:FlaA1/EpsC-like NDP-sugar epimerase